MGMVGCENVLCSVSCTLVGNTPHGLVLFRFTETFPTNAARSSVPTSEQIIHRCCAEIDLTAVFDGDISAAMQVLNESRVCGVEWKVRRCSN